MPGQRGRLQRVGSGTGFLAAQAVVGKGGMPLAVSAAAVQRNVPTCLIGSPMAPKCIRAMRENAHPIRASAASHSASGAPSKYSCRPATRRARRRRGFRVGLTGWSGGWLAGCLAGCWTAVRAAPGITFQEWIHGCKGHMGQQASRQTGSSWSHHSLASCPSVPSAPGGHGRALAHSDGTAAVATGEGAGVS